MTLAQPSRLRRWGWSAHLLAGAGLLLEVGALAILAIEAITHSLAPLDTNMLGGYALGATFPIVGWIIASRRPGNAIGWIFLTIGLSQALSTFAGQYWNYALTTAGRSLPFAAELAWVAMWSWAPGFVLLLTVAVLLFPDGRLPSTRWRPVLWATAAAILLIVLPTAIAAWPSRGSALTPSQQFPNDPGMAIANTLQGVGLIIASVAAITSVVGLIRRFRSSVGIERQQLKWFTFAGAIEISVLAVAPFINFGSLGAILGTLIPLVIGPLLPVAAAVAILRHRLYDIDVLVNRTAVYGIVTVVLASTFVVANIGLQSVLESLTGRPSALITGAIGAGVGLAFAPLRRRIRPVVDRFLPSRAVLTLLFTDIVGSTRTAVELGDKRWRALLGRYRSAVRRDLSRFGGHEVDTAGDGFFATFERPVAGVRCAWAIRAAVRRLGLETRTGVHLGECEMRGEKVSGVTVHTAARVMAAAADGEILVTDALQEAVAGADLQLRDRGRHLLKGVPREWQLYALEAAGGAG